MASLVPQRVAGMFVSGSTLYVADSADGKLYSVAITGATLVLARHVVGPRTLREGTVDWRARGAFVWSGAPADHVNVPPVAAATASCDLNVCAFNGSTSHDADGHLVSYAWDFGDGGSGTGAIATHAYSSGGGFDAVLTVTDNAGGTDTATVHVTRRRRCPARCSTRSRRAACSTPGSAPATAQGFRLRR